MKERVIVNVTHVKEEDGQRMEIGEVEVSPGEYEPAISTERDGHKVIFTDREFLQEIKKRIKEFSPEQKQGILELILQKLKRQNLVN